MPYPICLTTNILLYFSLRKDLLPCLKSFRVALVYLFLPQKCCAISADFHDVRRYFNLKTLLLYQKVPLEGGGFKPIFSVTCGTLMRLG